jgi:hypothetical protein
MSALGPRAAVADRHALRRLSPGKQTRATGGSDPGALLVEEDSSPDTSPPATAGGDH